MRQNYIFSPRLFLLCHRSMFPVATKNYSLNTVCLIYIAVKWQLGHMKTSYYSLASVLHELLGKQTVSGSSGATKTCHLELFQWKWWTVRAGSKSGMTHLSLHTPPTCDHNMTAHMRWIKHRSYVSPHILFSPMVSWSQIWSSAEAIMDNEGASLC